MANTLADLKATISDDLNRSDLATQIAAAITNAIDFYRADRFWFTESRDATFVTIIATSLYSSTQDADIPLFVKFDGVFLTDSSGYIHELTWTDPNEMEVSLYTGAASGRPYQYSYFNDAFRLYPIPDAVYTIRPVGLVKLAAPASDVEANNPWMVYAYELLRCRAKAYLALHITKDPDMLQLMVGPDGGSGAVGFALARLRRETSKKATSGRVVATQF